MNKVNLLAKTAKSADSPDMAAINAQALRELSADEVYTFKIGAADTEVDRDNEHFTLEALQTMAEKFVGRPVIFDHQWSAKGQTARIYAGGVEPTETGHRLLLHAYMLRCEASEDIIQAIEGGILREVSVGVQLTKATCDICGNDYIHSNCMHVKGREYDGKICTVALDGITDAYEVSFVAVPAQRAAGVTKDFDPDAADPKPEAAEAPEISEDKLMELALESARYI